VCTSRDLNKEFESTIFFAELYFRTGWYTHESRHLYIYSAMYVRALLVFERKIFNSIDNKHLLCTRYKMWSEYAIKIREKMVTWQKYCTVSCTDSCFLPCSILSASSSRLYYIICISSTKLCLWNAMKLFLAYICIIKIINMYFTYIYQSNNISIKRRNSKKLFFLSKKIFAKINNEVQDKVMVFFIFIIT